MEYPAAMPESLEEFAQSRERRGKPCWVCSLPEITELNAAHSKGVGLTAMYEWLLSVKGYDDATVAKLDNHFNRGRHHLRKIT